jgi:hypothetical protein
VLPRVVRRCLEVSEVCTHLCADTSDKSRRPPAAGPPGLAALVSHLGVHGDIQGGEELECGTEKLLLACAC